MRRSSLGIVLLGAIALLSAATTAQAGFDLADTATAGAGVTSPGVRFNGVLGPAMGSVDVSTLAGPGTNRIVVTAPGYSAPFPEFASLDFSYTDGRAIDFIRGDGTYDLVIQFGDIVIEPVVGSLLLGAVAFSENSGTTFSPSYFLPQAITAADSNRLLQINIPEASIPPTTRDRVNVVRLTFVITGAGTSFGINAVASPEPGTLALFGLGALGLAGLARRRRKRLAAAKSAGNAA